MNEGIHLDLDTWIVPGQIRKANLCRGLGNRPERSNRPDEQITETEFGAQTTHVTDAILNRMTGTLSGNDEVLNAR